MSLRSSIVTLLYLSAIVSPRLFAQQVGVESSPENLQDTFNINEYRVLGNTVLPATEIETAVYPHLGDRKTIGDVEVVRQQLE
ncbi:MAG: hypothetical protein JNL55_06535, partial [Steroidobacter sp.]